MAEIVDHVDVQAILETAVALRQSFGLQLFLVDDEQIPVDQRFGLTAASSYDDDYNSGTSPYNYANVYFSQKRVAEELMLGRWVSAASKVYFVCGPSYETDYLNWKAITDGSVRFEDSALNVDDLTSIDFSAITDINGVLTVLNAELAALVGPNINDLENAVFKFDSLGRLVLEMQTTGSSAPTVEIKAVAPPVGTDLSSASFMDAANGFAVAGVDAEEPTDALNAISQLNDTYYNVNVRGSSTAQQVALGTYIESKEKLLDLVVTDVNAKNAGATTDTGYQLKALSTKRTMCIYTEHTDQYPDAAVNGTVLPAEEGTTNWAYEVLSLVTDSGLTKPLTLTERSALKNKNYTWIETVGDSTYLYNGITSGNEEKRIMLGRDWFIARIREAIFADMLNSPLHAFDNPTLTKVEGFIRDVADQAIERGILVDTPARPFIVNMPDADDIDQATRATHKLEVYNAFQGYLNSAINDYKIVGTFTL